MGNHLICQKTTQFTLIRLTNLSIVFVFVPQKYNFFNYRELLALDGELLGGEVEVL